MASTLLYSLVRHSFQMYLRGTAVTTTIICKRPQPFDREDNMRAIIVHASNCSNHDLSLSLGIAAYLNVVADNAVVRSNLLFYRCRPLCSSHRNYLGKLANIIGTGGRIL